MNFCYGFEWKLRRDERQCLPEIVCDFSPDGVKAEKTLDLWARTELQRGTVKCLKWKLIIELIKYRHRLQLSPKTNTFIISMTRQLYYSPQASRPKPCVFPQSVLLRLSAHIFSLCIPLRSWKYFLVQTSLDQCFVNVIQVKTCKKNSLIKYLLYVSLAFFITISYSSLQMFWLD